MKQITYNIKNQEQIIEETVAVLKKEGLVIFPSDTVYGLVCDATNERAVKKLIAFKNRPPGKAISIFCNSEMQDQLVMRNKRQIKIMKEILPGPFTIILDSKHQVCQLLESEKGSLGIRIPAFQLINKLIQKFGKPVTATSANLSGRHPHYSIESLIKQFPKKKLELIDLIVNAGKLPRNKPSTVLDLTTSKIKIIRHGDIVFSKIKNYSSRTPTQTKKVAQFILEKIIKKGLKKPLIFIIEGEVGVGKTVFIKGIGEMLGIKNIISPTFVIYYEYKIKNINFRNFYHFDLYKIEEKEEFKHLGIEKLLISGNILCFEWGERVGEIIESLKNKGEIIYVKMRYANEKEREIEIKTT